MIPLRDENPSSSTPIITIGLIALNTMVFLYELSLPPPQGLEEFFLDFSVIPAKVTGHMAPASYWPLLTSMFLHGGWTHLIGNMLYLWIFGNNIEDSVGHFKYLVFYLICGIAASGAHILSAPESTLPSLGASGAISGVLGAYLLLFPKARILTLVPLGFYSRLMYVPSWVLLLVWFVMQLFSGWTTLGREGGGVAWWAHIGGFIAGIALVPLFKRRDVPYFSHGSGARFYWDD